MKWFGRKSAGREGPRPALACALGGVVSIGEWPRSYEAQVREAYLGNAVAQRAVRLMSESVGGAPLSGSEEDLLALVSARSAGQGLVETVAAHLLLHGNAYVQMLADASGRPGELFALRPERVTIEPDPRGWPAVYVYRVGERVTRLRANDDAGRPAIIHLKAFHPLDDHHGLGCLGAAAGAIAVHNAATRWNKSLLDNAARPSGALVYAPRDGAVLSPEQFGLT